MFNVCLNDFSLSVYIQHSLWFITEPHSCWHDRSQCSCLWSHILHCLLDSTLNNRISLEHVDTVNNADQIQCQAASLVVTDVQKNQAAPNKQQPPHLIHHHHHLLHCSIYLHFHRGLSSAPEVLDSTQFPSFVYKDTQNTTVSVRDAAWHYSKYCRHCKMAKLSK